jgi:phosphatidylglycerophosphatase A
METHEKPGESLSTPPGGGASLPSSLAIWIATVGGVGRLPIAPGTWGSALALALFPLLAWIGMVPYLGTVVAVTAVGTAAAGPAERALGRKDDGRIVIDEVAGQLLTLAPLVPLRESLQVAHWLHFSPFLWLAVTGFVAFRVLDVWKPGPVRWAQERFPGGLGVMADDLVAGVIGAVLMAVAALGVVGFVTPGAS